MKINKCTPVMEKYTQSPLLEAIEGVMDEICKAFRPTFKTSDMNEKAPRFSFLRDVLMDQKAES